MLATLAHIALISATEPAAGRNLQASPPDGCIRSRTGRSQPEIGTSKLPTKWTATTQLVDGKIVGGEPLEYPRQYQFLVSLQSGGHFCGGSLISSRWVLTAAHCVEWGAPSNVKIGLHKLNNASSSCVQTRSVKRVISHGDYDSATLDNDIALLELSTPVEGYAPVDGFDKADGYASRPGTMLTVAGWGATQEGSDISNRPLRVNVPVYSNRDCNQAYGSGSITNKMVCAGYRQGGKDSCQGDSGGPMFAVDNAGKHILVGIVSWGYGCAQEGYPGVYTRVSALRQWICAQSDVCDGSPPPAPAPSPSPAPGLCQGWCKTHPNPWERKCKWRKCSACSECRPTTPQPTTSEPSTTSEWSSTSDPTSTTEPPSSTSEPGSSSTTTEEPGEPGEPGTTVPPPTTFDPDMCDHACEADPTPWDEKCTWLPGGGGLTCAGCEQCGLEGEPPEQPPAFESRPWAAELTIMMEEGETHGMLINKCMTTCMEHGDSCKGFSEEVSCCDGSGRRTERCCHLHSATTTYYLTSASTYVKNDAALDADPFIASDKTISAPSNGRTPAASARPAKALAGVTEARVAAEPAMIPSPASALSAPVNKYPASAEIAGWSTGLLLVVVALISLTSACAASVLTSLCGRAVQAASSGSLSFRKAKAAKLAPKLAPDAEAPEAAKPARQPTPVNRLPGEMKAWRRSLESALDDEPSHPNDAPAAKSASFPSKTHHRPTSREMEAWRKDLDAALDEMPHVLPSV